MDYFNIYKDVWNFHKKYQNVQMDDAYWNAVIHDSTEIAERYENNDFVRGLLLAITDELERFYKELLHDTNTK